MLHEVATAHVDEGQRELSEITRRSVTSTTETMTPVADPSACATGVNDTFQWRVTPSTVAVVSSQ